MRFHLKLQYKEYLNLGVDLIGFSWYNNHNMKIKGITSDTHFGHANIILYANRPFVDLSKDVDSRGRWISHEVSASCARRMDEALIDGWNSVATSENDVILHLGDFAFCDVSRYLHRLRGKILFIAGNHDKQMKEYVRGSGFDQNKVEFLGKLEDVDLDGQMAVVCHYAMRVWNKSHYGSWHLYGHSHASLDEPETMRSMDVGVDAAYKRLGEYRPFTIPEIREIMEKKKFKPVDHHGRE